MKSFVAVSAFALFLATCAPSDANLTRDADTRLTEQKVAGVTVIVSGGVAMLTGEVADTAERTRAEMSVRSVPGIISVNNNLAVKPSAASVDPAALVKLDEKLKRAGCPSVSVDIHDGTVTVTGTASPVKYAECLQIIYQARLGKIDNQLMIAR